MHVKFLTLAEKILSERLGLLLSVGCYPAIDCPTSANWEHNAHARSQQEDFTKRHNGTHTHNSPGILRSYQCKHHTKEGQDLTKAQRFLALGEKKKGA